MARYGKFESDRELARTGFGGVVTLREAATGAATGLVVKRFEPPDLAADPAQVRQRIAEFLHSAELQKQIAAKSPYWAKIYLYTESALGAYYLSDHAALSVKRLIDGRVRLRPAAMMHIARGVVQGLLDLQVTAKRAHGNLKPSNILISSNHLSRAKIWLTDPAPTLGAGDASAAADLDALGKLFYELAQRRPYNRLERINPKGAQWKRLGSWGSRWGRLCAYLLDPAAVAQGRTLEGAAQHLKAVRIHQSRRGVRTTLWLALVISLGLLAWRSVAPTAFMDAIRGARRGAHHVVRWVENVIRPKPHAVTLYANAYRGWFGHFERNFPATVKGPKRGPPDALVQHLRQISAVLNPLRGTLNLSGILGTDARQLKPAQRQHYVRTGHPAARRRLRQAVNVLVQVESDLARVHQDLLAAEKTLREEKLPDFAAAVDTRFAGALSADDSFAPLRKQWFSQQTRRLFQPLEPASRSWWWSVWLDVKALFGGPSDYVLKGGASPLRVSRDSAATWPQNVLKADEVLRRWHGFNAFTIRAPHLRQVFMDAVGRGMDRNFAAGGDFGQESTRAKEEIQAAQALATKVSQFLNGAVRTTLSLPAWEQTLLGQFRGKVATRLVSSLVAPGNFAKRLATARQKLQPAAKDTDMLAQLLARALPPKAHGGTLLRQFKTTAAAEAAQPLAGLAKPNGRDLHAALAAVQARIKVLASAEQTLVTTLTRHPTDIDWKALAAAQPPPICAQYLSWLRGYFYLRPNPYTKMQAWVRIQREAIRSDLSRIANLVQQFPPSCATQQRTVEQWLAAHPLGPCLAQIEAMAAPIVFNRPVIAARLKKLYACYDAQRQSADNELRYVIALLASCEKWQRRAQKWLNDEIIPPRALQSIDAAVVAWQSGLCRVFGAQWPAGRPQPMRRTRPFRLLWPYVVKQTVAAAKAQHETRLVAFLHEQELWSKKVDSLRRDLVGYVAKFPAGLPAGTKSPWNRAVDATILAPDRRLTLTRAFAHLTWLKQPGYMPVMPRGYANDWNGERSQLGGLLNNLNQIRRLLDQAYLFDEKTADGQSIRSLFNAVDKRWLNDPRIKAIRAIRRRAPPIERVTEEVQELRRIAQLSPEALVAFRNSLRRPISVAINRAFGKRLGQFQPLTYDKALDLEKRLFDELWRQFKVIRPKARRRALRDWLKRQALARWQMRFTAVREAAEIPGALTDAKFFGVSFHGLTNLQDIEKRFPLLNARARYNVFLYQILLPQAKACLARVQTLLKKKALLKKNPNGAQAVAELNSDRAWAKSMLGQLQQLPLLLPPQQAALKRQLQAIGAPPANGTGFGQRKIGPAAAGWKESVLPPGAPAVAPSLAFTSPDGKCRLKFVLVHRAAGQPAFYLCATAVSVRVFRELMKATANVKHTSQAPVFKELLPHVWRSLAADSEFSGLHTWATSGGRVHTAKRWFYYKSTLFTRYAPGLGGAHLSLTFGGPPDPDDPVNYLPPQAAIYAAALLGCRLPTAAEWAAAYDQYVKPYRPPARKQNIWRPHLRGAAWKRQRKYVQGCQGGAQVPPPWPDRDTYAHFPPGGRVSAARRAWLRALPDKNYRWNRLWFCPVGDDSPQWHGKGESLPVHNLVGNIGQYVFDDSAAGQHWIQHPKQLTPAAVQKVVKQEGAATLRELGGSCIAPTGNGKNGAPPPPTQPVAIDLTHAMRHGFSDVGFRLAFSIPPSQPPSVWVALKKMEHALRRLLKGFWYVPNSGL